MIKSILKTSLFGLLLSNGIANAQVEPCATDLFHNKLMASDPAYAQRFSENNQKIANYIQNSNSSSYRTIDATTTYTIPVVVHVIHTGGAVGTIYNPSDNDINALLDKLNYDWANTVGGGVNMNVQFALAQRSPNCGTTTGIERINGSGVTNYVAHGVNSSNTTGADEVAVKDLSRWDHDNYVNVWVVNKIDDADGTSGTFTAGYAYFPGAGADRDGVIMLATQTSGGSITLSHEMGHFLNLYHTFQGDGSGSTCPTDADCGTNGDCVSDTPPHKRSPFNCPTGVTCTGANGAQVPLNFMDYSNCQEKFTAGQKTRGRAALATLRPGLMSSLGCVAPTGTVQTACSVTSANPTLSYGMGPVLVNFNGNEMVSGGFYADGTEYGDYSCTQQSNVTAGTSYPIIVNTSGNSQRVKVYIDYNNDGDFADAGELAFSHISAGGNNDESHTGNITIPSSGATTGTPLRMRVWADWYSTGGFDGPCGNIGYGQAEDYAVIVSGGGSCPAVTASISSSTNVSCNGGSNGAATAMGSGGSGFTYLWSNGATTASITGLTAGTYTCTVTNSCGNSNTATATITQPSAITVSVTGTNTICTGGSTTLTASGATTYSWSTGATTASITVSPSTTTTYNVTGTTSGCTGSGSRMVTVNAIPTVSGTTPGSRCGTGTVTLGATASSGTLSWFTVATGGTSVGTGTSYTTPSISASTTYYVSAANGSCASARSSVMATINAIPSVSASASPTSITTGQSSTVTATGATTYSWNTGATTAAITVSPTTTTSYSVIGTGSNGCTKSATVSVTVTGTQSTTTQLKTAYCGATLATTTSSFMCDAVTSATNYEYEFTDVVSSVVTTKQSNSSTTSMTLPTALAVYSKTYDVRVRAYVAGAWGAFNTVCQLSTPESSTKLTTTYCGATLATPSSNFMCDAVANATNYEYEFTDQGTSVVTTKQSGTTTTYLTLPTALAVYAKVYSVRVRAYASGVWGSFGTTCSLSTPALPGTKLTTTYCGAALSAPTSGFWCDVISGATNYEFEFTDEGTSVVTTKQTLSSSANMTLPAALAVYNKIYDVRVRAYVNGAWGSFGTMCQLSTAGTVPATQLKSTNCGIVLATSASGFWCDPVSGATNYEYEFTDVVSSVVTLKQSQGPSTNMTLPVALRINSKTYDVRVRAYSGSWGTFGGATCQITTPATGRLANPFANSLAEETNLTSVKEKVQLQAYPNPSNGTFTLQSNRAGKYILMNELGEVIKTYTLSNENNNTQLIEGLQAGLYIIVSNQTDGTVSHKIIVTK